jgi:hypothetical protein
MAQAPAITDPGVQEVLARRIRQQLQRIRGQLPEMPEWSSKPRLKGLPGDMPAPSKLRRLGGLAGTGASWAVIPAALGAGFTRNMTMPYTWETRADLQPLSEGDLPPFKKEGPAEPGFMSKYKWPLIGTGVAAAGALGLLYYLLNRNRTEDREERRKPLRLDMQ